MKTQTLDELMGKITPLPWSTPHFSLSQEHWDKVTPISTNSRSRCDCKYILCDSLMGAVATVHCADKNNEGDDPLLDAAKANGVYLAHAANNLPKLVEAVRKFNETRADVSWNCKAMWDAADNLKQALAAANEIKGSLSICYSLAMGNQKPIPIADIKDEIAERIWRKVYGDLNEPLMELQTIARRLAKPEHCKRVIQLCDTLNALLDRNKTNNP